MSREHRKNLKRGIKQPLTAGTQRVRASRHNKPHTHRVFKAETRLVTAGTPGAKRTIEPIDPKLVYPAGTIYVDGMAIVHRATVNVAHQVEVREPFTRPVPAGPTGTYGQPNAAPTKGAPKPVKR